MGLTSFATAVTLSLLKWDSTMEPAQPTSDMVQSLSDSAVDPISRRELDSGGCQVCGIFNVYTGDCGAFREKSSCWQDYLGENRCCAASDDDCCDVNVGATVGISIGLFFLIVIIVAVSICCCISLACCACCPCNKNNKNKQASRGS